MGVFTNTKSKAQSFETLVGLTTVLILIYLLTLSSVGSVVTGMMQLAPDKGFRVWTIVTYMFVHTDIVHLLSNLIMLWIGFMLIHHSRRKFFIPLFIIGGISGGIGYMVSESAGVPIIGSSNGVAAILASAIIFPNGRNFNRYSFRLLAIVLLLFALSGNICSYPVLFGHLSGAMGGFIVSVFIFIILKFRKNNKRLNLTDKENIINKIRTSGYASLTDEERKLL